MLKKLYKFQIENCFNEFRTGIDRIRLKKQESMFARLFYEKSLKKKTLKCLRILRDLSIKPKL